MACLYEHLKKHWVVYSDLLEACRSVVEWEASDGSAEPTPEVAERYMEMMAKVVSSIAKAEGS